MPQTVLFPVFERVEIRDYGLYCATPDTVFAWDFHAGPNGLIGANGLGKSTLVNILFRLLTGPYDLNRRALEGELGQPDVEPIMIPDKRVFARRVADQARTAVAKLQFRLGEHSLSISRRLSDLSLSEFQINGESQPIGDDDKDIYQPKLAEAMQVANFFDVLLILRFLVFVFEDRRSLVWDESAQRQIFRATMSHSRDEARRSLGLQREIVESDSLARNIRVQVNRAKKQLDEAVRNIQVRDASRAELYITEQTIEAIRERRQAAVGFLEEIDGERLQERRERMRAEHERDRLLQEIDGAKLRLIDSLFAGLPAPGRLALARVVESGRCACCGQEAQQLVKRVEAAFATEHCPYCEQAVPEAAGDAPEALDQRRIEKLASDFALARQQARSSTERISVLDEKIRERRSELQISERELNSALNRQNQLRRATSIEPDDVARRRVAVDAYTEDMEEQLARRRAAEESLVTLAEALEHGVRDRQESIANAFSRFANAFMRESCTLTYIGRDDRIGQEGARFRFPAFQVALSGGAVAGETLRGSPEAVSYSQREFIDVAFRMAVMDVIAPEHGSTLVVDTPEAGLDFVFAERAGEQFRAFGTHEGVSRHRVILTSNMVSEHLLATFLKDVPVGVARRSRLLNLIDFAAPTAAVRLDRERYIAFLDSITDGAGRSLGATPAGEGTSANG